MKKLIFRLTVMTILSWPAFASAQDTQPYTQPSPPTPLMPQVETAVRSPASPSMSQMSYAQWAVRRNAEFRGAQRRGRLAAMKWYGLSNSRPAAFATPFTGVYSNTWVGSASQPYRWSAQVPTTIIRVEPDHQRYYEQ